MATTKGNNRVRLSLRGKHRGERLKRRVEVWQANKKWSDNPATFHKPGSNKK